VHGSTVLVVTAPGEHAGIEADGVVTAAAGCVLAVRTADCAPVVLDGGGVVGLAHAGWRGLVAGVVDKTAAAMRELGADKLTATIGPCIRAGCYEFGAADLDVAAHALGDDVRSTTMWGTPALDLVAGVRVALGRLGVDRVDDVGACTACDPTRWFSHRARAERQRMATFAWLEQ